MNRLWEAALDLLFPPKCPFCRALLQKGEEGLCASCREHLPWLEGGGAETAVDFLSLCISPLRYRDLVRESVHRYKFSGGTAYAAVYGRLVADCVEERLSGRFDLVTWPPLSRRRLRQRGYDQAKLLAQEAARCLGAEAVPLLEKVRHTRAQSGLGGDSGARRANVLGAYRPLSPEALTGKRVLLIDDVVTTGSTLSECARTLRTAGAADVVGCALAKAGK